MQGMRTRPDNQKRGNYFLPNNTLLVPEDSENKGDLLIKDLWKKGNDSIHSMGVVNTDASSYLQRTPKSASRWQRKIKI